MFYAVIQCNREDCNIKECEYNFDDLPEGLLRQVVGGGKVVLGDNGFYCRLGQSVGVVYLFDKRPKDVANLYLYEDG